MNYPIPKYWEYFSTKKKENKDNDTSDSFSRNEKNELMDEYINYIKKHHKIFKSLPRVRDIYLCNSISFNKLHEWSDIDLFIVTKEKCLRRTRLISVFIFFILWLKRSKNNKNKKYCLSFYITENVKNLYMISLANTDIYLAYWLAHLVPIYTDNINKKNIYEYNSRLFTILPNLPKDKHLIDIWIKTYTGNTYIKNNIEKYISWLIWNIVEYLIKIIWKPILSYKTKKLKEVGKNIVFNDSMLKFYNDKRKKISLLYRSNKLNKN